MRNPPAWDHRAGSAREAQELQEEMLEWARLAAADIFVFYDFVLQKTTSDERVRIKDAPHHALLLEFLMDHPMCAIEAPVGSGKSFVTLAVTLFRIGSNPNTRGGIVSATQGQAAKVVNLARRYIETNPRLHLVFPKLAPSTAPGDPWTATEITVERSKSMKDPTLAAYGIEQEAILGSRLNWVLGDDILNAENTATPEQRRKIRSLWQQNCLSRNTPGEEFRACLVNTPWHKEDAIEHALTPPNDDETGGLGWPGMRMDAYGDIHIVDGHEVESGESPPWDSDKIRPKHPGTTDPAVRLVAHDPDPENVKPLWLHLWKTDADVDRERIGKDPVVFNRTKRSIVRDDATAMCPSSYVQRCYRVARALGVKGFAVDLASASGGPYFQVFTGVDPAFTEDKKSDFSSIFTFGVREDGIKVILDLHFGKWSPPLLAKKVSDAAARFNAIIAMESNSGGKIISDFMVSADLRHPKPKALRTGTDKWSPEYGVATFFSEMEQGDWAFPYGRPPAVIKLAEDCVNYVPTRHTSDLLMSGWLARKLARNWGSLNGRGPQAHARAVAKAAKHADIRKRLELSQARGMGGAPAWPGQGGVAANLMAR